MYVKPMLPLAAWGFLFLAGCGDTPAGPRLDIPVPAPAVTATLGFGDSPVIGEIVLQPTIVEGAALWRYAIDLEAGGAVDYEGNVAARVSVPYRYEGIGPHRIRIELTRGEERRTIEEFVVVNDPQAIEVLGGGDIPSSGSNQNTGIAVDRGGEFVYAARGNEKIIHRLNANTLAVEATLELGRFGHALEGLSTAPDEDLLYGIDQRSRFFVIRTPDLEELQVFQADGAQAHVHAVGDRKAYVSRGTTFSLLDTQSGVVLKVLDPPETGVLDFSLSPDGSRIALLTVRREGFDGPVHTELLLLTSGDLMPLWRVTVENSDPPDLPAGATPANDSVAFSAVGDRIYVVRILDGAGALDELNQWDFLVLDAADGRLLRRMTLGHGCDSGSCRSAANPVAVSMDGRFVAITTGLGAFFVDRELGLPLYRTPLDEFQIYCCDVASSPVRDEFYFNSLDLDRVTKLRIRR